MYIINAIFLLQHFPLSWKSATVIPILKPGKPTHDPNSYRPISLLNMLAKLAERCILQKINKFKLTAKIPDNQFGFKPGHSTTLLVSKLVTDVQDKANQSMNTVLLSLDIKRAFDTVWHSGLIYKLFSYHNFPLYFISLFHSYLKNRTFTVKVGNSHSNIKTITAGVPQGTVLSPILYNLYLSDLPTYPNTKTALFADDTLIYAHSFYAEAAKRQILSHLTTLIPYYNKWKISINSSKSESLVLTKKFTNNRIIVPLSINNEPIPIVRRAKYLGVVLDERLSFKPQVSYLMQKAYLAMQKLYTLLSPKSHLSPANKLLLYQQVIRPVITYAAPVWCSMSDTQFARLQRMQNKFLRCVTSSNRYTRIRDLHHMTNLQTIKNYVTDIANKFYLTKPQNSKITLNMTHVRDTPEAHITHKPPYHRLPMYFQTPPP